MLPFESFESDASRDHNQFRGGDTHKSRPQTTPAPTPMPSNGKNTPDNKNEYHQQLLGQAVKPMQQRRHQAAPLGNMLSQKTGNSGGMLDLRGARNSPERLNSKGNAHRYVRHFGFGFR